MQYSVLKEKLKDFAVFSLFDIRKIESKFYRYQLNSWQKKGYIKKLRRGYYIFSDIKLDEEVLFYISNKLYSPSYVSFESALSYYGLIPEGVYSITSACGKKTSGFKTQIANFTYRKIKSEFLFGYDLKKHGRMNYKIACMEKAVLDYLYLNPNISNDADFHEWRFNTSEFLKNVNISKLRRYAEEYHNKKLTLRLEKLLKLIKESK